MSGTGWTPGHRQGKAIRSEMDHRRTPVGWRTTPIAVRGSEQRHEVLLFIRTPYQVKQGWSSPHIIIVDRMLSSDSGTYSRLGHVIFIVFPFKHPGSGVVIWRLQQVYSEYTALLLREDSSPC